VATPNDVRVKKNASAIWWSENPTTPRVRNCPVVSDRSSTATRPPFRSEMRFVR
jgi:hypothetical protein